MNTRGEISITSILQSLFIVAVGSSFMFLPVYWIIAKADKTGIKEVLFLLFLFWMELMFLYIGLKISQTIRVEKNAITVGVAFGLKK